MNIIFTALRKSQGDEFSTCTILPWNDHQWTCSWKKFYSTFSYEVIETEKDYAFKYFQIFKMFPQNQITASQRCGDIKNLHFSKTCCFNKVQNQKWSFKFDVLVVSSFCFECTFDIKLVKFYVIGSSLTSLTRSMWKLLRISTPLRKQIWKLSHTAENFVCSV